MLNGMLMEILNRSSQSRYQPKVYVPLVVIFHDFTTLENSYFFISVADFIRLKVNVLMKTSILYCQTRVAHNFNPSPAANNNFVVFTTTAKIPPRRFRDSLNNRNENTMFITIRPDPRAHASRDHLAVREKRSSSRTLGLFIREQYSPVASGCHSSRLEPSPGKINVNVSMPSRSLSSTERGRVSDRHETNRFRTSPGRPSEPRDGRLSKIDGIVTDVRSDTVFRSTTGYRWPTYSMILFQILNHCFRKKLFWAKIK